jgi:hypothetical protein
MGLGSQLRAVQDILLLKGGHQMQGELKSTLSLSLPFGIKTFSLEEISLISASLTDVGKVSVRTCDGELYSGTAQESYIIFSQSAREDGHTYDSNELSVPIREIDAILLKPRRTYSSDEFRTGLHVILQNGDIFPVMIADREILLTDGWNEKKIVSSQVLNLAFNGGVYGKVLGESGEEELPLLFSKSQVIHFVVPSTNQKLQLPWKNIVQLATLACLERDFRSIVVSESSKTSVPPLFSADDSFDLEDDVIFFNDPMRLFADNQDWNIPDHIQFIEDPAPVLAVDGFDKGCLEIERLFAVSEDFNFEGSKEPKDKESVDAGDEIEFIAEQQKDSHDLLAVGVDFEFEDTEEPKDKESVDGDEIEFIAEQQKDLGNLIMVGADFEFEDTEESEEEESGDAGDEIEFIAEQQKDSSDLLAVSVDFEFEETEELEQDESSDLGDEVEFIVLSNERYSHTDAVKEMEFSNLISENRPAEKQRKGTPARLSSPRPIAPSILQSHYPEGRPIESPSTVAGAPFKELEGMLYIASDDLDVPGFYIKPEKVTNSEYRKFVDAINYRAPSHWIGGEIPRGLENSPVVNVSYKDAFLYSVWAGKRLPTQDEMERAFESPQIAQSLSDQYFEWTSTPSLKGLQYPRSENSVRMGNSFSAAHQVFGSSRIISMSNDEFNNRTGFRIVLDAH